MAAVLYFAVVTPSPEGGYAAEFPDLPGVHVAGPDMGALLAAAREARARPERLARREPIARPKPAFEDDLFEDPAPEPSRGARR